MSVSTKSPAKCLPFKETLSCDQVNIIQTLRLTQVSLAFWVFQLKNNIFLIPIYYSTQKVIPPFNTNTGNKQIISAWNSVRCITAQNNALTPRRRFVSASRRAVKISLPFSEILGSFLCSQLFVMWPQPGPNKPRPNLHIVLK